MRVRKEEVPVLEALGVYFKYGYGVDDIIDWYAYQCLPYLSVMISIQVNSSLLGYVHKHS